MTLRPSQPGTLKLVTQGRVQQAIEHYTRAIAAGPKGSEKLHRRRAHSYRKLKMYDEAVADYTRGEKVAGDKVPYMCPYQRATVLWILGRAEEAVRDYRRVRLLLGRPFYSDARQYLILREQGRDHEAAQVLEAALHDVEDHWLRQIFRCLAGQLSPDELVADGVARNNPEQLCEAYYYAAEVCLLANKTAEARAWFEQCVGTGVRFDPDSTPAVPMNEYELAEWRLESLGAADSSTSRP